MSRILRRPMFRGGPVDSRGTGITSGLMDGGRVGYQNAGVVTGGELVSDASIPLNFSDLANTKFSVGMPIPIEGAATKTIEEQVEEKVKEAPQKTAIEEELDFSGLDSDFAVTEKITDKDGKTRYITKDQPEMSAKAKANLGIISQQEYAKIASAEAEKAKEEAKKKELEQEALSDKDDDNLFQQLENEAEERPEIDAKTAVAENKKLFAELLGGDKARSQDIGDMLLRFAAAPGSTTGEKFQTYLDAESKAGKGRLEKINETAAALAINDYVAGKRSKEDIAKLKEVATFKESLGNKFTDNLIKIAGPGTIPTASHIESALRTTYPGRNVTRVKSTDKLEISEADKGTFILEEDTKKAFLITGANSKKQVY
tara:strand:+ start:292 stop:1407 length:1116 start_codon:yes stop_codon:yes gene_type:complete